MFPMHNCIDMYSCFDPGKHLLQRSQVTGLGAFLSGLEGSPQATPLTSTASSPSQECPLVVIVALASLDI